MDRFHREFDAPVDAVFAAHRDPDKVCQWHTIRDNEFALQTFEFDGAPDEVTLEYMWFEDLGDGRTRLRGRSIARTVEGRDAMVESGMEHGMAEGYVRLETLVTS